MNRWLALIVVAVLAMAMASTATATLATGTATATATVADRQLLPDLQMAPLADIGLTKDGTQRQLRFSATIINTGEGPFEVLGTRASTSDPMTVVQHIYHSIDPVEEVPTTATMFFAGDGHTHWHLKDLETYRLIRLDDRSAAGTSMKSGFCFADTERYDLSLPGAPQARVYLDDDVCAPGQPDALAALMGLSVGWGDKYPYNLPDQFIDITGLPGGVYRLRATADLQDRFVEANGNNNSTRVDLRIRPKSVTVLG